MRKARSDLRKSIKSRENQESLSDPIQLPRYSDSHSHDSEEEDACASLDLSIFDLPDHFCLVCVVACLG